MPRYVVIGNSGSGKSSLAQRLVLPHLDLDTLAWYPTTPPARRPLAESARTIDAFVDEHRDWVIEGCYADLAALALPHATELVFLNPGVDACTKNAHARPWEPHKYATREAQDANLTMLIDWIRAYETRTDELSLAAHRALFDGYAGAKCELTTLAEVELLGRSGTPGT
jgi:adenylate kinase family enzyme